MGMCNARLLAVSPSIHCAGGVAWSRGVLVPGGTASGPGGVPASGPGGGGVSQHAMGHTPPVNRITDT